MASSDAQCSNDATATARRVHLVPTEIVYEGQQTYTRHDDKPPPLCDAECLFSFTELAIDVPAGLHPRTADLVRRFAAALAEKLAAAEARHGYSDNWASPDWMGECRAKLVEHVAKGDPRDVAAYAAFLWHHGERTSLPAPAVVPKPPVIAYAVMVGSEVYELELAPENAEQERRRIGGRVVELSDRALLAAAKGKDNA